MPGFITPGTAGRPGEVHTTAKNELGKIAEGTDGKDYIYLQGVASTIAGSWVAYDELGVTLALDSDTAASLNSPIAVATAATVANTYGWYGVRGSFSAGAGTVADNGKVYATSTAFICDDAAVTGNQVHGAVWRSADASSLATVQIDYPFIGVTDAII